MSWNHATSTRYLTAALSGITGNASTVMLWLKKTGSFAGREFGGISNGGTLNSRVGFKQSASDGSNNSTVRASFSSSTGATSDIGDTTGVFSLTPNVWHCLVFSRSAANNNSLYLNGALLQNSTGFNRDWASVLPDQLCLGRQLPSVSANADAGSYYAEFAVWDVALDATAIGHLCTGTGTGKAANHADVGTTPILYAPLTTTSQLSMTIGGTLTENGGAESWDADHPTITSAGGGGTTVPVMASYYRMLRSA